MRARDQAQSTGRLQRKWLLDPRGHVDRQMLGHSWPGAEFNLQNSKQDWL